MPGTTARPGDAGRREDNSDRNAELPNAKHLAGIYQPVFHANDGEHLQPSSGRVATAAAARPDGTDERAAAWLAWPPSAVLCAFIVEGALRPPR